MPLNTLVKSLCSVALVSLWACSGDSGQKQTTSGAVGDADQDRSIVYQGPTASSDTVTRYKLNVWDNLAGDDRCGACHNEVIGQTPMFLRRDDINLAHSEALDYVNETLPMESRLVEKVAAGHNCWGDQAQVCAEIITNYLEAWLNAGTDATEKEVVLTAPEDKQVGASLKFPESSANFETTLWPLLRSETVGCVDCHSEDGARQRQQPYFASANVDSAYQAALTKINLNDAASLREPIDPIAPRPSSRLIVRLRDEAHNCWADPAGLNDCRYSAEQMQSKVAEFLNSLDDPVEINDSLKAVASRAVNLVNDGVIASSGGRFESNVIALYEFKFGRGSVAFDYSGVSPELNLNLSGDVSWVGSWGLRFNGGSAVGSTAASKKLHDRIKRTGEYALEAWVIPANVTQDGPARIVTYSGSTDSRNFMLGQTLYDYDFYSRSSQVDQQTLLSTPDADEILQATLQHVVINFHPTEGRRMYVNGTLVAQDGVDAGNLNDWDDIFVLSLGAEVGGLETWQGTLRLLAIHERQLTEAQVTANYEAGVGQKYYLLFGVSHLVNMPQAYVVFQVEVFDDYSYLFNSPFFISLDKSAAPPAEGIVLEGMRLGQNGIEVGLGQAYANLSTTITRDNYNAQSGVPLATVGTVIASEQGASLDEFFLTFDRIGGQQYTRAAVAVPDPEAPVTTEPVPDVGMRIFGEINASLAAFTGVSANDSAVQATYSQVIQQLPQVEDLSAFLPAHQAGIMQLAVAYCTALVNDNSLRSQVFAGFDFNGAVTGANQNLILDPLLKRLAADTLSANGGQVLASQPHTTDTLDGEGNTIEGTRTLLGNLLQSISDTEQAVIATCTAMAGSAVMAMQ